MSVNILSCHKWAGATGLRQVQARMLPVTLHRTGERPQKGIIQLNADDIANVENSST